MKKNIYELLRTNNISSEERNIYELLRTNNISSEERKVNVKVAKLTDKMFEDYYKKSLKSKKQM